MIEYQHRGKSYDFEAYDDCVIWQDPQGQHCVLSNKGRVDMNNGQIPVADHGEAVLVQQQFHAHRPRLHMPIPGGQQAHTFQPMGLDERLK